MKVFKYITNVTLGINYWNIKVDYLIVNIYGQNLTWSEANKTKKAQFESTQLMLTEYISKNNQLEETIETLRRELRKGLISA